MTGRGQPPRPGGSSASSFSSSLTVATFNVHGGVGSDGFHDLPRIADLVAGTGATVVALQEVNRGYAVADRGVGLRTVDQVAELADRLRMSWVFGPNLSFPATHAVQPGREYGVAVLSTLPVLDTSHLLLPRLAGEQRGAVDVRLDLGGRPLRVVCAHFEHTDQVERLAQSRALVAHLEATGRGSEVPTLVVGDLNTAPGTAEYAVLTSVLTDAWTQAGRGRGRTIGSRWFGRRIDYVMLGGPVRATGVRVWPTRASDHALVSAELLLAPACELPRTRVWGMGKASRRRKADHEAGASTTEGRSARRAEQVPFVRRPFEGLPGETDWVAMREILPAATAAVTLTTGDEPREVTVATVLPLAWPALHRNDGTLFVGTQTGSASGDASRDLAAALLAVAELGEGVPLTQAPQPTADTPRLQDILDTSADLTVAVHGGFEFWVGDTELEGDAKESLERANESVIPTTKMAATPSAYWCRIGERTHIRLVLPDDEDAATDALARLLAHGDAALGGTTRLLGAFRASGLLVPVWDLDPELEAEAYEDQLGLFATRYGAALKADADLTVEERRARSGLLSRQVTLR